MATFKSIIEIVGDGSYANDIIELKGNSTVGTMPTDVVVVGDVAEGEIDPSLYTAYEISKVQWETSDGKFYGDVNATHKFATSGIYQIKLTVWSEPFLTGDGRTFYFTHASYKDVTIESRILKFFLQNNPTWEQTKNDATLDFYKASANFFEKIYRDTTGLFDLWDAERINPQFFEYLAMTLGHSSDYSKKVGYNMTKDDFSTYDIYDRIKKNIASKEEIQAFRRFLILTSDLFRKKGSSESVERFLSLFTINAKVVELWTKNWGQTPVGEIDENFIGFDLEDNKHGFVWKNIRVVGNCITEKGYIRKNLSSITIDNYHDIEKIQYPSDVVAYVTSGEKQGWEEIEIEKSAPYVFDIRKEDGNILVDEEVYKTEPNIYDIVTNDPARSDESKLGVLQIKPESIEIGDRLVVAYYGTESSIFDSVLATKEKTCKDFDARAKFVIKNVPDPNIFESYKYPENEVFVLFRGIQGNTDLYATFGEYYKVVVNGRRSTASLVKVTQTDDGQVVYQKLNVSGDRNAPVYDIQFFKTDDPSCPSELKPDTFYELEVRVVGSLVSAYLYENEVETAIQNNIDSDTGGNPYGVNTCKAPTVLFENVTIEQDSAQIITNDVEGNDVLDKKYTVISEAGHYGFGIRSTIVDLKDFYVNILDADETLYITVDKEFNLMPKYLDYRRELMKYNNSGKGTAAFSNQTVIENYDPAITDYNVDTKSMSILYADNAVANEAISTRYTVSFDEAWMKENFENTADVVKKIILPFGGQRRWFIPDSRSYDKSVYKNYFGGTSLKSGDNYIPGLFRYNDSMVLDTYDMEPGDNFSALTRDAHTLTFSGSARLLQYLYTGKGFGFRGVFQEVCPYSGNFSSVSADIILPDNSVYKNPVFQPITVDTLSGVRVVGVRFKSCDDIERLIAANSTPLYKSVQLYGQFSMDVPVESIRYCPDKTAFTAHPSLPNTYVVKFFIPLGVLDKNRRTYSLNSEFLQIEENTGSDLVRVEGIFVRNPKDLINYKESDNQFVLAAQLKNPYEDVTNSLFCKYYLSGQINLATGIQSFDYGESFPTTYICKSDIRNLLHGIEVGLRPVDTCVDKTVAYSYENDYQWWMPKTAWRKRDIEKNIASYGTDILSGINYNKNNTFDKFFYNFQMTAGSDKPRALSYKITDGTVNKNTVYYAKVNVYIDYMGFSYSEISKTSEPNNPIDSEEMKNIVVRDGKYPNYTDFKRSPVSTCSTFYIPISWYPEVPANNSVEWFNYIVGSAGDTDTAPSISMTPIGLMTYLVNNAGNANKSDVTDDASALMNATREWTVADWNALFDNNVDVEFIAEEIPKDKYKLFDKYAILPDYPINAGTEIRIKYNVADRDSVGWSVYDNYTIYAKSNEQKIFDLPAQLKSIRMWAEDVTSVTLNKLIIPNDLYTVVSDTKIRFNPSAVLENIKGSTIVGRYFFDLLFDDNLIVKVEDDFLFNKERTINLLPYESSGDRIFSSSKRMPNENLVMYSQDNIYNIVNVNNEYVFKSINKNSSVQLDYKKSGVATANNNEVSFSKGIQSNILKLYVIDDNNGIFDISTYFKFDPKMNSMKNYDGKKFEFILKAETIYDPVNKKHILGSYYFVGVGVYNFDIGLGVARYNTTTGVMEKSFLAGFGEYNTRGVDAGKWYKLRAIVTEDFIRVVFNGKNDSERMVINYNIGKKTQTDTARYIDGSFDELVYIVTGLDKNGITYPGKLGEKTSSSFVADNFNEELVKLARPSGTLAGVVFHNELTYLTSIEYISQIQGLKVYGDTHNATDSTNLINEIYKFTGSTTIDYVGKTTSNTLVILAGGAVFYQLNGKDMNLYDKNVTEALVNGEYVIIRYNDDVNNVTLIDQNFTKPKSIYVKDLSFNVDHLFNYLRFTNRSVKNMWNGKNKVYIEFEDNTMCVGGWDNSPWDTSPWDTLLC